MLKPKLILVQLGLAAVATFLIFKFFIYFLYFILFQFISITNTG